MKSVKSSVKCKVEVAYPKLQISTGTGNIYLMNGNESGTCVFIGEGNKARVIGQYSHYLERSALKDYDGSVCLENDA